MNIFERDGTFYRKAFWTGLGLFTLIRILLINIPEIIPQEAYYWNYGRNLALGYFDHPAITAWTIRFFCTIFGNNLFGIRFTAVFYGALSMVFLYLLGKKIGGNDGERLGFFSSIALAITPLGIVGGNFVTPDPALICFWILSIYLFYIALFENKISFFYLAGLSSGLAMLSKYTAVFLYAGFAIMLLCTKNGRKYMKTPHPYIAVVLAIMAFSPQIIWNAQNEWASFAFQSSRRASEVRRLRLDYFGGYILSQFLVVSPLFFIGLWRENIKFAYNFIKSGVKTSIAKLNSDNLLTKDNKYANILFLVSFSLPYLVFFTFVGLIYWIKINWLAPAYISGFVLFIYTSLNSEKVTKFFKVSFYISFVLTFILYLQLFTNVIPMSGEMMTVAGWNALAEEVDELKTEMPNTDNIFVFGWKYKVPACLSFYLDGQPETYSSDVLGYRLLQYHYWFDEQELLGKDAIFIVDKRQKFAPSVTKIKKRKDITKQEWKLSTIYDLENYFENADFAFDFSPENSKGEPITTFSVYRCYNYRGPEKKR